MIHDYLLLGNYSRDKAVIHHIREHGFDPDHEIDIRQKKRVYVMRAEDFMEHGEEILQPEDY